MSVILYIFICTVFGLLIVCAICGVLYLLIALDKYLFEREHLKDKIMNTVLITTYSILVVMACFMTLHMLGL